MLLFLLLLSVAVQSIHCIGIKVGSKTQTGFWTTKHEISISFQVGGKTYFFGTHERDWFIQELLKDGTMGRKTSYGSFLNYYTKAFPFNINGRQFIYAIDDNKYWFTQEILPGGIMGDETDRGYWESYPTIIFPLATQGNHYIFSLTGNDWFIKKVLRNGRVLKTKTDEGTWQFTYTIGFPFSISGRQYIYCVSDYHWVIQGINEDGTMGVETDNGNWQSKHILNFPIDMNGKQYFYGLMDSTNWFIQELLPGGKMGSEKKRGAWFYYYPVMFAFNIDGYQYVYGFNQNNYSWFIQELKQTPRFGPILEDTHEYCSTNGYSHSGLRKKRQLDNGVCDAAGCKGLNFIEEYITDIRLDDFFNTTNLYDTDSPYTSYSTFSVPADDPTDRPIELTAAVEAEIHSHHLSQPNSRQPISRAAYNHVRNLGQLNDDDAGHLLADSMGGSVLPFNFVPQSSALNRNVHVAGSHVPQQGWYDIEDFIRNFIRTTNGYVRWSLAVIYGSLRSTRRPTDFWLSVRLFDANGHLTGWNGTTAVTGYHFRNVPIVACADLNHPWWSITYA